MQPDLSQPQARLGEFNWRMFGHELSQACFADGRSQAAIADEMGVTESDLSRARGGGAVSVAKVMAIADWMKVKERRWYVPPRGKSTSCTGSNVKQSDRETSAEGGKADRPSRRVARPAGGAASKTSGAPREAAQIEAKP